MFLTFLINISLTGKNCLGKHTSIFCNIIQAKGKSFEIHPPEGSSVALYLMYDKFIIEEHVETLVYDTASFLAQAGGNLGLFLGFSCLSVLLGCIQYIRKF